jgi:hypothetical protein
MRHEEDPPDPFRNFPSKIHIDLHVHSSNDAGQLAVILSTLEALMANLDALTAQVTETDGVIASAVTLIEGISAALKAAGTDPAKLAELQSQLKTNSDALAAAVAANPVP